MARKRVEEFVASAKSSSVNDSFDLEGRILQRNAAVDDDVQDTLIDGDFLYFTTNGKGWIKLPKSLIQSVIPTGSETHAEYTEHRALIELQLPPNPTESERSLFSLLQQVAGNLYNLSERKQASIVNWWRNAGVRRDTPMRLAELAPPHPSGDIDSLFVDQEMTPGTLLLCSHRSCCANCSSDCPRPTPTRGCPTKNFCTGKKAC